MYRTITCLSLLAFVVACDSASQNPKSDPSEQVVVGLQRLSTCQELDTLIREKTRTKMNKELDDAIASLQSGAGDRCMLEDANGVVLMGSGATRSATTAAPTSVSKTNNQVEGVDEADLVKTDGLFIYLAQGSEFRIVSAWPAADAALASRVTLEGTAKRLFVLGDRALVYVSVPRSSNNEQAGWMSRSGSDCTYGYSCDFSGDGSATKVVLFDIANRAAPTVLPTIDMPGSLIAARRIGSAVHTVASIGELTIPGLESYYGGCGSPLTGEQYTAE